MVGADMKAQSRPPQSICLVRLSALGDVCNCIALARALRRAHPEIALTWVIGRAAHRLVQGLDGIEFIRYDKQAGLPGMIGLRRQLAQRRFDVLLLAQVSLRANLISLMVKAPQRIGFDRARSREGHGLVINQRIAAVPGQHQALAFLEFARALGIDPDGIDRAPPIPASARAFALSHQPKANRAVLISPASSHPLRNWCAERYARVADWVIAETGRPVFLMGGPGAIERSLGQAIEAAMGQRCVNLIGQDSLAQSLAMIERSACLITPDSGPAHFAAALGTPVIGLYAATWSRRSGPLGSLDHCVDRYRLAAQTYLNRPAEDLRWGRRLEFPGVMDLIETAAVIARLQALLQSG